MIIYLNSLDPSRPLQSGPIPQDVNVPGTYQEQQHHSELTSSASGALITISILLGPARSPSTFQFNLAHNGNPQALIYKDFITNSKDDFLFRKIMDFNFRYFLLNE